MTWSHECPLKLLRRKLSAVRRSLSLWTWNSIDLLFLVFFLVEMLVKLSALDVDA